MESVLMTIIQQSSHVSSNSEQQRQHHHSQKPKRGKKFISFSIEIPLQFAHILPYHIIDSTNRLSESYVHHD